MADPKIKYDIEAAVKGEADAEGLAKVLTNVADVLEGDLQKGAKDAAAALEALAGKQRAIDQFVNLRRETESLGSALNSATQQVDRLGNELPQATAQSQAMATTERAAAVALGEARASLESKRAALAAVREETQGTARRTDEYKSTVAGLKDGIKAATVEVKAQQEAQRTAAQAATQAQNAEAGLRKEYDLAIGSAVRLSGELGRKNVALTASRDGLQSLGVSTTNLVQSERNLATAVDQVRQEVVAMVPAYQAAASASSASTQTQAQNQRTLRDGMTSISTQLQRIQQIATIALGGSYIGGLAKSAAETADEFKNLQARVQLVTGEGAAFQQSWAGVTRVALATNSALEETGTLFARIAKAAQEGGASAAESQRRALALTETINQSVQLSGSSAEASKAAITQLIQGLQSGVLRGDEFNSVMEQAPRLAQAMAAGLGVNTGELRKLAEQGALTTESVMKALQGQADVVAAEFGKLPPTVGRALQNLSTQWTLYIGESDKGIISSANAAKVIDALAKNLDTVVSTLLTAGKAWAAIQISGLVADFARWATNTLTASKALEANTAAAVTNTAAQRANAAAQAENAAAQTANTAATGANTAARAANAKAWSDIAVFSRAASGAQTAATANTAANTAALGANVAAASQAGIVWRAASGLIGPWGIALAALTPEIFSLAHGMGEGAAKAMGWGKVMEDAERKMRSADEIAKIHVETLRRQAEANQAAADKTYELSKQAVGLIAHFDKLRKDGESVAEAIGKIGKDFDLAKVAGIRDAGAVLDKLLAAGKLTATEFQGAWAKALDGRDLAQFEVMARAAFAGSAREAERLQQFMDAALREAVNRTGLDFALLEGRVGTASRSAINDVEAIIRGLDRLKSQGIDTGRVLTASLAKAIDTADTQKALEAVRAQIESVRKVLGDKLADDLLDQARDKSLALSDALDKAKPGINSLREAMQELGLKSVESLQKTAREAVEAYDTIKLAGRQEGESYEAWQVRKTRAAEVMIQRMIDANGGIVSAAAAARASAEGLEITTDSAGRTIVRAMGEAADATRRVGDAARGAASNYDGMRDAAARAAAAAAKTADGFRTNADGSAAGTFNNNLPVDQAFALVEKRNKGTLAASDLESARAAFAQAEAMFRYMQEANKFSPGSNSMAFQQSTTALYVGARDAFEKVAQLAAQETKSSGSTAAAGTTTSMASTSNSRTVNVNLDWGSGAGSVSTDEAGAATLEQLLKALEAAKRATGK